MKFVSALVLLAVSWAAVAQDAESIHTPLIKPLIDVRARYENVEQDGMSENANASTIRARLGFETAPLHQTTLLAEGEFVGALTEHYNSTTNGKVQYPVVGDGDAPEINRLQLVNTALPGTSITVGRQRINLGDQRFVGNAAWRQNEQTYDSVRIVNRSIAKLMFDVAYVSQVNRVFGKDSPVGRYDGDNVLANIAYDSSAGKLTAFAYRLDFDVIDGAPPAQRNVARNDSSQTFGMRFEGNRMFDVLKLGYVASYATQDDSGHNPVQYSTDYHFVEVTGSVRRLTAGLGMEALGGTGSKGFATPLASLHKFQGWADKFLTTPVDGIDDRYVSLGYAMNDVGVLQSLSVLGAYHRFDAERGSRRYGHETDVQVAAKWKKFSAMLKLADYRADDLFTDTRKVWAQIEYIW